MASNQDHSPPLSPFSLINRRVPFPIQEEYIAASPDRSVSGCIGLESSLLSSSSSSSSSASSSSASHSRPGSLNMPTSIPANHFLAQGRNDFGRSATPSTHSPTSSSPSGPSSPHKLIDASFLGEGLGLPDDQQRERNNVEIDEREDWNAGSRPDTSSLAAADYDVSVQTGFLPPTEPLRTLKGKGVGVEWDAIEEALEKAQEEAKAVKGGAVGRLPKSWRCMILKLAQPPTETLNTLPLLRRAHVALSFLSHFYIHSTYPSLRRIPRAMAVPWFAVSEKLGLPPILTYADTVLWNWHFIGPSRDFSISNIGISTTFTSTESEKAFFLLSLMCELHAPYLLRLMSATLDESFFADTTALNRISSYLTSIAVLIKELSLLLRQATRSVRNEESGLVDMEGFGPNHQLKIVPRDFYWDIRPWFNGGRWFYEGVGGVNHSNDNRRQSLLARDAMGDSGVELDWSGPSAGQSSLVHALDLFLGISHTPRPSSDPSSSSVEEKEPANHSPLAQEGVHRIPSENRFHSPPIKPLIKKKTVPHQLPSEKDSTFMIRMAQYMPSYHRSFLEHLSSLHTPSIYNPNPIPSLRELAQKSDGSLVLQYNEQQAALRLRSKYNETVQTMKEFRDCHMILVTVFIVQMARTEPSRSSVFWEEWDVKRQESRLRVKEDEEMRRSLVGDVANGSKKVAEAANAALKGTGGTELVSFLKACKTRTLEALIPSQST